MDGMANQLEKRESSSQGAHYELNKVSVVAAGTVFTDALLHPNESISAAFVFYVPQEEFDLLAVFVAIPTVGVRDSAEAVWTVTPNDGCFNRVYRRRNGRRAEEITDPSGAFSDRGVQLQYAIATRQLSLWQSKQSPASATKTSPPSRSR